MTSSAQGQDRSSYQSVTNWDGLDFGFVKATEGLYDLSPHDAADPTFAANWANLVAEGKPRGAYHFFHPEMDPVLQAQRFVAVVQGNGLNPGDMLVLDTETAASSVGLSWRQVDKRSRAFLDEVRNLVGIHNPLLVYTMHEVGQHLFRTAGAYPLLWFAWPSTTAPGADFIAPWPAWTFWQWGQNASKTDEDAYNGTVADLAAFLAPYKTRRVIIHWRVLKRTTLAGAAARHSTTPGAMIRAAARAGHVYGRWMRRYIAKGDWNAPLPIGAWLFAFEESVS